MSTSADKGIEVHGRAIDPEKKRVVCHYCEKIVGGFNRLKHHLGGVGTDVTACTEVPPHVKAQINQLLLNKKKEKLLKEVGRVEHPELPLRRVPVPILQIEEQEYNLREESASECRDVDSFQEKQQKKRARVSEPGSSSNQNLPDLPMGVHDNVFHEMEVKNKDISTADSCIGRFFFDAGIDPVLIKLPSFQRMVDAVIGCGAGYKAPHYEELRGHVLEDEAREVNRRVDEIKSSWVQSGCSILLDGWTGESGKELISFLASCPEGIIFIRSMDATDAMNNPELLFSMVCEIIETVGPQNVVQVVAHNSSDVMETAGRRIMEAYKSILWTLCADHSINLILEQIEEMDHIKKVMNDARKLTRFIYGNELTFELMKKYITLKDLVVTSNFKSVASFITLKNIVAQKDQLIGMLNSTDWLDSRLASGVKGRNITKLVKDCQFWNACFYVLMITDPIIGVLHHIIGVEYPAMGFIYDSMDKSKEQIRTNVAEEQAKFQHVWAIIDDIWDNDLHSPLHAAAYNLNARLFYSSDFYLDSEVSIGLMYCIVRMAKDRHIHEKIVIQFNEYKEKQGGFGEIMAMEQLDCLSPDKWWSVHGSQYPELQRWAVRILSQNCSSATRYMLRKDITEKLHSRPLNYREQQKLCYTEFVSNNRHLWRPHSTLTVESMFCHEVLDPSSDWVVECGIN